MRVFALALLVSLTVLAPVASAVPEAPTMTLGRPVTEPVRDALECFAGPHTPETMTYYIVWGCTAGMYFPEPVKTYTGCQYVFAGEIVCSGGASDLVYDLTGCRLGTPRTHCR